MRADSGQMGKVSGGTTHGPACPATTRNKRLNRGGLKKIKKLCIASCQYS